LEETPSYDDAIRAGLEPGDERWMTAEVVSPNRFFFLDGVMQSDTESHVQQHEALVHPAMFSHPHPQKVAIGTCSV
jgi:spermidine synthase